MLVMVIMNKDKAAEVIQTPNQSLNNNLKCKSDFKLIFLTLSYFLM